MTTNSPNPVDGDVQVLKARIAGLESDCWIYENTIRNLLERAQSAEAELEKLKAIVIPPTQLLRPVELPDCDYGAVSHMSGGSKDYCNGFVDGTNNAIKAIREAGYEVKND